MRAVDKGESPYTTINNYQDALPYLERKIGLYVDRNLIWNLFYLNTFLKCVLIQLIIKNVILMTFKNDAFYNIEMNL